MSVLAKARAVVTALNERERLSHGTPLSRVPWDRSAGKFGPVRGRSSSSPSNLPSWDSRGFKRDGIDVAGVDAPQDVSELPAGDSPGDASAQLDAFRERLAICAADDIPQAEAIETATRECGISLGQLVARQIQHWTYRLASLPQASDRWLANLHSVCFASLAWPWLQRAVGIGWTDAELFGLNVHAPKIRVEAMGLIVGIAASRHQPPLSVVAVTEAYAQITTGTGARLMHRRHRPSIGPPIWEHPAYHVSDIREGRK